MNENGNKEGIKPFMGYDLLYPPSLKSDIQNGKKIELLKLTQKGMILVFDIIQSEGLCTSENLSEIPRIFENPYGGVIYIDIDEMSDVLQKRCEFIRETGIWGDFWLCLFQQVYNLSDIFEDKAKEIERAGLGIGHNPLHVRCFKYKNQEAEKEGYEQDCMFLSTHESLLSPISSIEELNRRRLSNWAKNGNSNKLKRKDYLTKSIRHEVFKRDGYKCCECSKTKNESSLEIDHILPISRGGSDELDNLQTLCSACNRSKSNRVYTKENGDKVGERGKVEE